MRSIDLAAPDRAEVIRADFDRIADADPAAGFDASARYVAELLNLLPARIGRALDLGSGSGILVRRLAARADHVIGIDLSPRMMALARESSAGMANIEWRIGNFMADDLPAAGFDAVCSVATFHHLPLDAALARAASLVRPGGWLLVVDLFQPVGVGGFFHNAFSWLLARWEGRHRPRPSPAARDAWRAHERNDSHPTLAEVRAAAALLPGARVAVRARWRWTLAWRRPEPA